MGDLAEPWVLISFGLIFGSIFLYGLITAISEANDKSGPPGRNQKRGRR
jgi:hypothetical protein